MANITYDLAAVLSTVDDLRRVALALAREQAIREGVARTGEDRQTVADFLDAHISMDQEAVLSLTDGDPTTLADGLRRYVEALDTDAPFPLSLVHDLTALLVYPWPGEQAEQAER